MCAELRDVAVARKKPASAIKGLAAAVVAAQPTPDHLTPQHAMLFQCCLLAKCHNAALPILERAVFEVVPTATGVTSRDFLTCCYYGGSIFAGLRRYEEAAALFLHAVTAPATAVSAVVVAAYKRYVCVSLIGSGAVPPFPRYTAPAVQRHLKSACAEYINLSDAYKTRDREHLAKAAKNHEEAFAADGNGGLVSLVVDSLAKARVQRLTQTYLTLSLSDIASAVKLPGGAAEAERIVVRMIERGEIFASVSQRDGMVSFHEIAVDQYSSAAMARRLDEEIREAIAMSERVRAVNEAVRTDRAYLSKAAEMGSGLGGLRGMGAAMGGSGGDMDFSVDP